MPGCNSKIEIKTPAIAMTATDPPAAQAIELFNSGKAFELSAQNRPTDASVEQMLAWEKKASAALKSMKKMYGSQTKFEFMDGVMFDLVQEDGQVGAIPFQMKIDVDQPSQFTMPFGQNEQAYVVLKTKTDAEEYHIHVLLWPNEEQWKIAEIAFTRTQVAGKNAEEIYLGGTDAAKGAKLVESLAILSLADRMAETPRFRVAGLKNAIKDSASSVANELNHPPGPVGQYEVGESNVDVTALNAVISSGHFYLQIHNRINTLIGTEVEIRTKQIALAKSFIKAHPTLRDYYFGLGVSTASIDPKAQGAGYRTVYSFAQIDDGDPTPPKPANQATHPEPKIDEPAESPIKTP